MQITKILVGLVLLLTGLLGLAMTACGGGFLVMMVLNGLKVGQPPLGLLALALGSLLIGLLLVALAVSGVRKADE